MKEKEETTEDLELTQELLDAGEMIRRLPKEDPPKSLAERALARASEALPEASQATRRLSWWLRPITHPAARIAAAVLLVGTLGIFAHLDTAERVGRMTEKVIGQKTTDHLYNIVDRMLPDYGPVTVKENDLDRLIGGHGAAKTNLKSLPPIKNQESTAAPRSSLPA